MKIECEANLAADTQVLDPQDEPGQTRNCLELLIGGQDRQDNLERLQSLISLFNLSQADLVHATGYSRAFVSRLLGGTMKASPAFWAKLNSRLLDVLTRTGTWCTVFKV